MRKQSPVREAVDKWALADHAPRTCKTCKSLVSQNSNDDEHSYKWPLAAHVEVGERERANSEIEGDLTGEGEGDRRQNTYLTPTLTRQRSLATCLGAAPLATSQRERPGS